MSSVLYNGSLRHDEGVPAIRLPALVIGDLIAPIPLIQGGMGVAVSLSGLASAVANEGGIGVISVAGIGMEEPDFETDFLHANIEGLRKQIRRTRQLTKGIIGVNILVALSNFEDMVRTSIEEGIDIIFSGAGLPLSLPAFLRNGDTTKLSPIVSSGRAAAVVCRAWDQRYGYLPDAVVVEGPLAGGHLGFSVEELAEMDKFPLERLVTDTLAAVKPYEEKYGRKVPVIAAGGIFTGQDIARMLRTGAAGVQMATRFVATDECDASHEFKRRYLEAKQGDAVIIKSPVGMPGRALKNEFLERVARGERIPFPCHFHCLRTCEPRKSPYCIARALTEARNGDFSRGFAFCGANVHRVERIVPVRELVRELISGAEAALDSA